MTALEPRIKTRADAPRRCPATDVRGISPRPPGAGSVPTRNHDGFRGLGGGTTLSAAILAASRCVRRVLARREGDTQVRTPGQSLTQIVQTVVRAFDDERLQPVARSDASRAFKPKTLLALLSYTYARDIFGSADVEDALRRDVQFRHLCNGEFPDARTIRRFRRHNREALHRCLTATLRSLAEGMPFTDPLPKASDAAFAEDASRRITKAMWIDSAELED